MTDAIIAAWIGVAGTVVAGIGGAWIGGKVARDAARGLLIEQTKAEFFASFNYVLVELHTRTFDVPSNFAQALLQEHFSHHLAAYLKLRSVLCRDSRSRLDAAWKKYTNDNPSEDPEERAFNRFSAVFAGNTSEERNLFATKHVGTLLAAA